MEIPLSLIEQLREFETALVTEALTAMGLEHADKFYTGNDIKLLTKTEEPLVGAALTLVADTSTPTNKPDCDGLWQSYDIIRQSPVPVIVVIKAIGSRIKHECILGDGMAKLFKSCGSCGLITDGGARDLDRINKVGYTVFGSGTVSNHVKMIYRLSEEPVNISGVHFHTGDLIHADQDGIVMVPKEYHKGIVDACIMSRDIETRVHTFWRRSDKTPAEKKEYVSHLFSDHHIRCKALLKPKQQEETPIIQKLLKPNVAAISAK